jgi:hypothetical protein
MAEVEKDERLEKCKEPDVHPKENVKLPCYTEEQKELECELEKKRGLKASHCLEWSGLTHEEQPYLEISEHGLIGNLCSCALVGVSKFNSLSGRIISKKKESFSSFHFESRRIRSHESFFLVKWQYRLSLLATFRLSYNLWLYIRSVERFQIEISFHRLTRLLDSQKGGFFGIQPQEEKGSFNYHQVS